LPVDVVSALAGQRDGLDRQQIAADFRPRETGDLADLVLLLGDAVREAPHAQVLVEILRMTSTGPLALRALPSDSRNSRAFTTLRQILLMSRSRCATPASRV